MNKLFILLIFIFISLNFVSAYNCYQEFANVSTSCGGLNTGLYAQANWAQSFQLYDGDWAGGTTPSVGVGTLYINYTKPSNANSAILISRSNSFCSCLI